MTQAHPYLALITGTRQVETAVIVAAAGITTAGNATVTVTAAGMTGSPKAISVALALNDTAAQAAGKIRTALAADADVSAMFLVSGADVNVVLTAIAAAANDATLNIAYADDTSVGLADDATSNDTTAGSGETVTFQDGLGTIPDWPLLANTWAPTIPGRRRSQTGGRGPYEDAIETFTVEVRGSTAAEAYANLATLARVLDQAEDWSAGENVDPVLLYFAPAGSTVSSTAEPLQCAVLGRAEGDQTIGATLTPQWDKAAFNYVIPSVTVSLLRRGMWLAATEDSDTPAAADNGELVTFTLSGAVDVPSPTRIELTNFGYGKDGSTKFHGGYLLLSEAPAAQIPLIFDAEDFASGVFTSVTDAGQNPRDTNILRFTPGGTTVVRSGSVAPGVTFLNGADLVAVFANVRPSATVSFQLRASLWSGLADQCTPYCPIPTAATLFPTWRFLGLAPISGPLALVYLDAIASAGSSFMDIDSIVLVNASLLNSLTVLAADDDVTSLAVADDAALTADHRLLDEPQPAVRSGLTAYSGDAVFTTKAATLYGLLLATGGGSGAAGNDWRQAAISGDAVLENEWTVYRREAFLVPQ